MTEIIKFERYGHGSLLLKDAPTLGEILKKQNACANRELEPSIYLALPDLLQMYVMQNAMPLAKGMRSLLTPERDVLLKRYGAADKYHKKQAFRKLYGVGFSSCTAIRVSDTALGYGDAGYDILEKTRQKLNEQGFIAVVDYIDKKDKDGFVSAEAGKDTYLIVFNNRLDYSHGKHEEIPVASATNKILAIASYMGLISDSFLTRNGIDPTLGLLPGLRHELETQGHFTSETPLPTIGDEGRQQAADKAIEQASVTFEVPDNTVSEINAVKKPVRRRRA